MSDFFLVGFICSVLALAAYLQFALTCWALVFHRHRWNGWQLALTWPYSLPAFAVTWVRMRRRAALPRAVVRRRR